MALYNPVQFWHKDLTFKTDLNYDEINSLIYDASIEYFHKR